MQEEHIIPFTVLKRGKFDRVYKSVGDEIFEAVLKWTDEFVIVDAHKFEQIRLKNFNYLSDNLQKSK